MTDRDNLLASIAATTADYRAGELAAPTPDHVDKWIRQFDRGVQLPILKELNHVLKQTYLTKAVVSKFFGREVKNKNLTGPDPCAFWSSANIFGEQQDGHSQEEIVELFGETLKSQCNLSLDDCGGGANFVYFDDVLFTGGRIETDLRAWITDDAPQTATVYVVVIAAHRLGEYFLEKGLPKAATEADKDIKFRIFTALHIENRLLYRDQAEVLWPCETPNDPAVETYLQSLKKPFEPRKPGGSMKFNAFSSEQGRQLLEREFLLAGVKIRSFSQNPAPSLRPLGKSPFGLGFGSTIVTYRNCPNNSPLALWWGDPKQPNGSPLSKWYPLFQRKPYKKGNAE